jgi:HEAT repeat protein
MSAAEATPAERNHNAGAAKSSPGDRRREDLRYARRSFEEWRDQLLNDLDAKTCIEAVEPMAAFGKRGYAAEATAALAEVLRSDRKDESEAAAGALARIGSAALPALIDALADERPHVRFACTQAIESLGVEGKPAAQALVKLLDDRELVLRAGAVRALAAVAGDEMELWPTFERLAASRENEIRYALVVATSFHPPQGRWWLRSFLRLADDPNPRIRAVVGGMLAQHGPFEQAVIDAVERLVCDDDVNVSSSTTLTLARHSNPQLLATVFADAFKSPDLLWAPFSRQGHLALAIARLASFPEQAEVTAPLLARFVESGQFQQQEAVAAIDGLGVLGPAAKIAFPALKRIIQNADLPDNSPLKKHAQRSLDRILATDEPAVDDN